MEIRVDTEARLTDFALRISFYGPGGAIVAEVNHHSKGLTWFWSQAKITSNWMLHVFRYEQEYIRLGAISSINTRSYRLVI